MKSKQLIEDAVKNSSGEVDVDATLTKWRSELENAVTLELESFSRIGQAVEDLFSANPKLQVSMKVLEHEIVKKLGDFVTMSNYQDICDRISSYIHTAADQKSLVIARGPGKGCRRWTDEDTKREADEAAKAASVASK